MCLDLKNQHLSLQEIYHLLNYYSECYSCLSSQQSHNTLEIVFPLLYLTSLLCISRNCQSVGWHSKIEGLLENQDSVCPTQFAFCHITLWLQLRVEVSNFRHDRKETSLLYGDLAFNCTFAILCPRLLSLSIPLSSILVLHLHYLILS